MNPLKVLIIEDDKDLSSLYDQVLQEENIDVLTVHCANEALVVLKASPMDLVITDHGLPDILGADLILELKKLYPELPVILITGSDGIKSEANINLQKPINVDSLMKAIEQAVHS